MTRVEEANTEIEEIRIANMKLSLDLVTIRMVVFQTDFALNRRQKETRVSNSRDYCSITVLKRV